MSRPPLIMVVDDEDSICKTLESVFRDEGYECVIAANGANALEILSVVKPDLVLLDIWMPDMDGIETLRQIKILHPNLPVVMISGHASISTALAATRLGALDFIEKPLDLSSTLGVVERALGSIPLDDFSQKPVAINEAATSNRPTLVRPASSYELNKFVFERQAAPGRKFQQKTIGKSVVLYGQGLHSGRKSGLILEPLPANSGIHFVAMSETKAVPAYVDFVESTGYATTVRLGQAQAGTIEHLMSALHAYGISNLLVKCNGELPVMDGSALEFCNLFDEAGLEEQDGDWFEIKISRKIRVEKNNEFIEIEPADRFSIEYRLNYPDPIGLQVLNFELGDVSTYKEQIAPARTFGFLRDVGALQKQGLALGGRLDNFVLIGDKGVLNGQLRFPDEMVRHKILDAIGDLYLLGRPLCGKVTASMTGHSDNVALLKELKRELLDA